MSLVLVCLPILVAGCRQHSSEGEKPRPVAMRSIEAVLKDHTTELMAIPGVIGLYQAALKDGTPCIKVMVVQKTPGLVSRIPNRLEGYPVRIDVTGVVRPLGKDGN